MGRTRKFNLGILEGLIKCQIEQMHEDEFEINEYLVRTLLQDQCPKWANLPLKRIPSSGTDHALFRLGNEYVVRLPRLDGANDNIHKECEWLPKLARFLKVPISEPLFKGQPTQDYPSFWTVTRWNEGKDPDFELENEYENLAQDLAHFLNEFQNIKLLNGPPSRRGIPLMTKVLDEETRLAISQLNGEIDIPSITSLWDKLSNTPPWNKDPVWVHGDLLPGNILIQNNRLGAVIDFSSVGIGDPACDLIIAWSLLNSSSREVFRKNLENIDSDTWERGRGWALSIALIIIPYYRNTNPALTSVARRMIRNLLL
jgi:aminoglycoside phosphotransferase (APT) family kinase protein